MIDGGASGAAAAIRLLRDPPLPGTGETVWLVGPLRRGRRWETTAIPDIREQAAALPTALWQMQTKVMVSV
jgi:hypothetical protein